MRRCSINVWLVTFCHLFSIYQTVDWMTTSWKTIRLLISNFNSRKDIKWQKLIVWKDFRSMTRNHNQRDISVYDVECNERERERYGLALHFSTCITNCRINEINRGSTFEQWFITPIISYTLYTYLVWNMLYPIQLKGFKKKEGSHAV